MALEERDIFNAICQKYNDKPVEFIMEEYKKAVRSSKEPEVCQCCSVEEAEPVEKKKKITKRSLKVKPEDSIKEDIIYCCICGNAYKVLSKGHIKNHGLTKEEYLKLCGFDKNQVLMSLNAYKQSLEVINIAHEKRKKS